MLEILTLLKMSRLYSSWCLIPKWKHERAKRKRILLIIWLQWDIGCEEMYGTTRFSYRLVPVWGWRVLSRAPKYEKVCLWDYRTIYRFKLYLRNTTESGQHLLSLFSVHFWVLHVDQKQPKLDASGFVLYAINWFLAPCAQLLTTFLDTTDPIWMPQVMSLIGCHFA